jgi:hypothetical protein
MFTSMEYLKFIKFEIYLSKMQVKYKKNLMLKKKCQMLMFKTDRCLQQTVNRKINRTAKYD